MINGTANSSSQAVTLRHFLHTILLILLVTVVQRVMAPLNPEAILKPNHIIHTEFAHYRHIYGSSVGVAVLDTGIFPRTDFLSLPRYPFPVNRIQYFHDFVNQRREPYDDSGHGTHICGKIASSAQIAEEEYLGIAPGCNLIVLKTLDQHGNAPISTFIQALRWLHKNYQTYNIRIVNISIGTNLESSHSDTNLLVQEVDTLWRDGLVVIASAGNNGPTPGSISSPGNSCLVITVGASDDNLPVLGKGSRRLYSGRGPVDCNTVKPEIVAPGTQIISCSNRPGGYAVKTGTSMSTALVSGAIALLLEQEPYLTNEDVKNRLHNCARRLDLPHFQQGWGQLDIPRLLNS